MNNLTQRLSDLFDYCWESNAFDIRRVTDDAQGNISFAIWNKERTISYGEVYCGRNVFLPGYKVEISYAAFNGEVADLEPQLKAITLMAKAVAKMQQTSLIQKGV